LNRFNDAQKLLKTAALKLPPKERAIVQHWLADGNDVAGNQSLKPSPTIFLERARKAAEQNRLGEAIELCRKAIALWRDFLPAYELLLQLYQRRNDLEHAVKGFTQLANRQRDDLPLNFAAATALSLSGQHRRAITYWRRVCALTDNSPDAMLKLAESLEAVREDVQAKWVRKFVERLKRWEGINDETD
jgi:tetratricopeptide (TPR) repeat protein